MKKFFLTILICFWFFWLCFLYASYEYSNLQVRNFTIKSKELPENFSWKKILFLADFQLYTSKKYNEKQMEKIINLVNKTEKDIILLGWDYKNYWKNDEKFFTDLQKIKIPEFWGFAVLWNHDYDDEVLNAWNLEKSWFFVLNNKNKKIKIWEENIFISWVEDYWYWNPSQFEALKWIKNKDFNIFLTHNPDFFEKISEENKRKIDLTLAWHTHWWQVTLFWKIIFAPIKNIKKYGYGMKEFNWDKIYITSWVWWTVWDFFIRFFAKPEIVVFTLEKEY